MKIKKLHYYIIVIAKRKFRFYVVTTNNCV